MTAQFNLDRFVTAQDAVLAAVRRELSDGEKRSHWMWYIFPQLAGLGHSPTARFYALASLREAKAFLDHPVLGPRLIELTGLVNNVEGRTAHQIFGNPDDMKFHSCISLFSVASAQEQVFRAALHKYFGGRPDARTMQLLEV